jgi:hypothetical protein
MSMPRWTTSSCAASGTDPRLPIDGAGEVVEVHDLLDDPRLQVLVEPDGQRAADDGEHAFRRLCQDARCERIQACGQGLADFGVTQRRDLSAPLADGAVVVGRQPAVDLHVVLDRGLDAGRVVDGHVEVVAHDPHATAREMTRDATDGLLVEHRRGVPRVAHDGVGDRIAHRPRRLHEQLPDARRHRCRPQIIGQG